MLDQELIEQLKTVLAPIEKNISLVYKKSNHEDQVQLLDMLKGLTQASPKIQIKEDSSEISTAPHFHIEVNGKSNGIAFHGIPGGHEFTSLILALLNSDGKGKFPDPILIQRIKALKGPIRIQTFISLTCENCPDVVQALNLMALIHNDFQHLMIDGSYVPNEIESLGIQGVPSLVVDSKMIHSGRISLLDLITKLEQTFGVTPIEVPLEKADLGQFDVVVIGGGPAGASSAIYSVRKGLKTAIIAENIGGQVQETRGIENLISIPMTEGPLLAANLATHIAAYPIVKFEHRRVKKIDSSTKKIELESGEFLHAEAIIVATGAKWRELGVPGEKEYIGRGVAFCPHCDGPYYKGKKVAVVGGGNSGVEAAIDLAGIVKEVVLVEYNSELKADKVLIDKLLSLSNVSIQTNAKTESIKGDGQKVLGLQYLDRTSNESQLLELDGVFVQIGLVPNSQFLKGLVELTPFGEIVVDPKGRTSVAGIYAAGDVTTTPYKQIIIAMGEGAKTALAVFEDRMLKH